MLTLMGRSSNGGYSVWLMDLNCTDFARYARMMLRRSVSGLLTMAQSIIFDSPRQQGVLMASIRNRG